MSHDLTNEVLNHIQHKRGGAFLFSEDYKAADEIITAWLREKAQELTDATIPPTNFGLKQAMEILGLSSPATERLGEHIMEPHKHTWIQMGEKYGADVEMCLCGASRDWDALDREAGEK